MWKWVDSENSSVGKIKKKIRKVKFKQQFRASYKTYLVYDWKLIDWQEICE